MNKQQAARDVLRMVGEFLKYYSASLAVFALIWAVIFWKYPDFMRWWVIPAAHLSSAVAGLGLITLGNKLPEAVVHGWLDGSLIARLNNTVGRHGTELVTIILLWYIPLEFVCWAALRITVAAGEAVSWLLLKVLREKTGKQW